MSTLMMLGAVSFEIAPLNATGGKSKGDFDFAEHKPLGGAPIYENMGEGERTRTIKGVTYPNSQDFQGGEAVIRTLEEMRRAGVPYPLMRGDGVPLGWFLITSLSADEDYLAFNGVPHEIKFEVSLTQCEAPFISEIASIIGGFFS